jgi:hypothetical protein
MRRALIAILLHVLVASCDNPFAASGDIEIRISNESSVAFDDVDVVFPEDSVDYGLVPAHGRSAYRGVSVAYRYALIIVKVGGQERRLQPIDYVGETELRPGRYTYLLDLTTEGHLTLDFLADN